MTGTDTTKCFADRLQDLIADSGKDMKTLASEIGISSGALSKYQNDNSEPGITALAKIAQYFGVTADYLVGMSDSKNLENANIGQVTGLSDEAIDSLKFLKSSDAFGYSEFIESRHFLEMLLYLARHKMAYSQLLINAEEYMSILERLLRNEAKDIERKYVIDEYCEISETAELMSYRIQKTIEGYIESYEYEEAEKKKKLDEEISTLYSLYLHSDYCPAHLKNETDVELPWFYLDNDFECVAEEEGAINADNPEAR